jgi:hypothetical protein
MKILIKKIENAVCVLVKKGPKRAKNPSQSFTILQGPSYAGRKLK